MRITIKFLTIILLSVLPIHSSGMFNAVEGGEDEARKLLDNATEKIKRSGGTQLSFEAATFKGKSQTGGTTGTFKMQGRKFFLSSQSMKVWFDGTTQWTLLDGSDEVNVSKPTVEEQSRQNPYSFINLYKSGYRLSISKTSYSGKQLREVRMVANSKKQDIQEVRIVFSNDDVPLSVRLRHGKNEWIRIRCKGMENNKSFPETTFKFRKDDYPDIEIIDLR